MSNNQKGWAGLSSALGLALLLGFYQLKCDPKPSPTMSEIMSKYPTASETLARERADRAEFEGRFEEAAKIRRDAEEAARKEREFQAWRSKRGK